MDVLEHQPDDVAFLVDLIDATPPGTTFILTVPALMSLWSDWDVDLGHYRRYSRQAMRDVFASLPIDVMEISYLFPELLVPGWFRAARSRWRRSSSTVGEAAFPELPGVANTVLYRLCTPTLLGRRYVPLGSSILAAGCSRRDIAAARTPR
jgi:hypothetical protein